MHKFSFVLGNIMKPFLAVFFFLCALGITYNMQYASFGNFEIVYLLIIIFSLLLLYLFSKLRWRRTRVAFAVFFGAVIRLLWLVNANTQPVSDYYTMYSTADSVIRSDFSGFSGVSYFARFPHLTVMTMYISAMKLAFSQYALIAMKCVNVALGSLTIYLVYVLCKNIFGKTNERSAYMAASLTAVFPPFITYAGILCTENIAIPLFIASMISFFSFFENKKAVHLYISGILLAIGNLFRMVALVVLVAYMLYLIVFDEDRLVYKIRNAFRVSIPYIVVIVSVSSMLILFGVTETHLWNGCEPKSTNVLKGLNFDSGGRWSAEDSKMIEDNLSDKKALDKLCKEEISARINNRSLNEIVCFYCEKLYSQWSTGDCGGTMITLHSSYNKLKIPAGEYNFIPFQLFIAFLYLLSIYGILKTRNRRLNLLYMIYGGYMILLLITENQARYSLISIWILLLMCAENVDIIGQQS